MISWMKWGGVLHSISHFSYPFFWVVPTRLPQCSSWGCYTLEGNELLPDWLAWEIKHLDHNEFLWECQNVPDHSLQSSAFTTVWIVVPLCLQKETLDRLHEGLRGIVRCWMRTKPHYAVWVCTVSQVSDMIWRWQNVFTKLKLITSPLHHDHWQVIGSDLYEFRETTTFCLQTTFHITWKQLSSLPVPSV